MATEVATLSEHAEQLAKMAENCDDEEPVVLIGDVTGSVNVSAKDEISKYGPVGFAQGVFDGNGVYELGQKTDHRFFGTMLVKREHLNEETVEQLEAAGEDGGDE